MATLQHALEICVRAMNQLGNTHSALNDLRYQLDSDGQITVLQAMQDDIRHMRGELTAMYREIDEELEIILREEDDPPF